MSVTGPSDPHLLRLFRECDVVLITPGWPGTPDVDRSVAPDAAWVAVTPFGLDGPRADWRASDLGIMAATGNLFCTGDADRPPVRSTEPAAYAHGGVEAAFAVLSALASTRPQLVDVSLHEAAMVASLGGAGRAARTGQGGQRAGCQYRRDTRGLALPGRLCLVRPPGRKGPPGEPGDDHPAGGRRGPRDAGPHCSRLGCVRSRQDSPRRTRRDLCADRRLFRASQHGRAVRDRVRDGSHAGPGELSGAARRKCPAGRPGVLRGARRGASRCRCAS